MILVFGRFLWQPHKRTYDKISAEPHNKCWRSGSQSGQNYFGLWAQHQWAGEWMPPLHMKLIQQKCHYWKCREVDCHFCRITKSIKPWHLSACLLRRLDLLWAHDDPHPGLPDCRWVLAQAWSFLMWNWTRYIWNWLTIDVWFMSPSWLINNSS